MKTHKPQQKFNTTMILVILALIFMNHCNAQNLDRGFDPDKPKRFYAWMGFDAWNAFEGGKFLHTGVRRNTKALDVRGGFTVQLNRSWEFGAFLELFPKIDYYGAGVQLGKGGGFEDLIGQTDLYIIPFIEGVLVHRSLPDHQIPEGVTVGEYFNHAFGLKIRLDDFLIDGVFLESQMNLMYRADIRMIWGPNALPDSYLAGLWENRSLYITIGVELFRPNRRVH